MSFFRRGRKKDTDEFIARERAADEERHRKFLEERERVKPPEAISEPRPKKKFSERFRSFADNLERKREEKRLRQFKKHEELAERKAKRTAEAEKRVHGRELTASERSRFADFQVKKEVKSAQQRKKFRENLSRASRVAQRAGRTAQRMDLGGGRSDTLGFNLGGLDLSASPAVAHRKREFEANFGSWMQGKKGKKVKRVKDPLDDWSVL